MALTLQQAADQLKLARALAAEKKAARKDIEDRAKTAVEEDRAAGTAEDNARDNFNRVVDALTAPVVVK